MPIRVRGKLDKLRSVGYNWPMNEMIRHDPTTNRRTTRNLAAGRNGLAADPLWEALGNLCGQGTTALTSPTVQAAFERWQNGRAALSSQDPESLFVAEAILFQVIRKLYQAAFGADLPAFLREAEQPFFDWFHLPEELRGSLTRWGSLNLPSHSGEDLFGKLYESLMPALDRKRLGFYVTPPDIADLLLDAVGYDPQEAIECDPVVDLACGSGALLLKAAQRLIQRGQALHLPAEEVATLVQRNVVGLDWNPFAIFLTQVQLLWQLQTVTGWRATESTPFSFRLEVADTLEAMGSVFGGSALVRAMRERTGDFIHGVRFLVGNPPYGKVKFSSREERYFRSTVYGHPNLYGLFLQAGVDLLGPGGRLSYLTPSSMLSGLYFKNLRRYLARRVYLREMIEITSRRNVFDDVLQGVMILAVERRADAEMERGGSTGTPALRRERTPCRSTGPALLKVRQWSADEGQEEPQPVAEIPAADAILERAGEIYFLFSPRPLDYEILRRFFAVETSLGSPEIGFKTRTGPIVWNRLKDHLSHESEDTIPLLWSNEVGRYRFQRQPGKNGGRSHLKRTPRTVPLLSTQPAILVQRTTAQEQPRRLVAAYPEEFLSDQEQYAVENHLNCIVRVDPTSPVSAWYVLGLLNSKLYDYVFRILNGSTQVSATELDLLPVPIQVSSFLQVAVMERAVALQQCWNDQVDAEIDNLVFSIFGLTPRQRAAILDFYNK